MKATHLRLLYVQIGLALAIAACATTYKPETSPASSRRVQFDCEGTSLTVKFDSGRAELTWKDGEDVLDQKPAASGFWYESPRNSVRGKQHDLTWNREGHTALNCREVG